MDARGLPSDLAGANLFEAASQRVTKQMPVITPPAAVDEPSQRRPTTAHRAQALLSNRSDVPGVIGGRYWVTGHLGTGGMGSVWRAYDDVLRRAVALKRFKNHTQVEEGACALREARAAAAIAHPNVVAVHDLVFTARGDFIVMEALGGISLAEMLRQRSTLPTAEVRDIAIQLLSALLAIHQAGLVHRDIKPSNVHLEAGRVVLTDFGLTTGPRTGDTGAGVVAGSLPYLAPETLASGTTGPSSDMYALGVTLLAAIEGRKPNDTSELGHGLAAEPSSHPMISCWHTDSLGATIAGLVERDPSRRLDAADAIASLSGAVALPRCRQTRRALAVEP